MEAVPVDALRAPRRVRVPARVLRQAEAARALMQIRISNKRILAFFGHWGPEDGPADVYTTQSHRMWWKALKIALRRRCTS